MIFLKTIFLAGLSGFLTFCNDESYTVLLTYRIQFFDQNRHHRVQQAYLIFLYSACLQFFQALLRFFVPVTSIMTALAEPCNIAYMVILTVLLRIDVMVLVNRFPAEQTFTMLFSVDVFFVIFEAVQRTFTIFPTTDILVLQFLEID